MDDEILQPRGPSNFSIAMTLIAVIAIAFALLFRALLMPEVSPLLGQPFPRIEAGGWINGPAPTAEELHDQVLVVDAWAYWCDPCRIAASEMVPLYMKYKDRGVRFIGLTSEGKDEESIKFSHEFVSSLKLPWPNGYAAAKILSELEVHEIPQLFVVDRKNRIVFHERGFTSESIHELDLVVEKALQGR